jgi:dTDP-4-dehydrorhamnose 3,5-epimerase
MLKIIDTGFRDLYILEPRVFEDERGYFYESYNLSRLKDKGIQTKFVQDNESRSSYGVIRGLHYQLPPFAQTKLLRVVVGKIIDVAVDLRKSSPTFGSYYAVELSGENKRQFYIPQGFAHGFSVISDYAIVNYKCDNFYSKGSERGICPIDPSLNIDWRIEKSKQIISEKDSIAPEFGAIDRFFD